MDINLKSQNLASGECIKATACAVCNASSSGIHFGVTTCEACKGFFRRSFIDKSMSQPKSYKCLKGANLSGFSCIIDSKMRVCRYCRLKKCLSVGMSIECKFKFQLNIN